MTTFVVCFTFNRNGNKENNDHNDDFNGFFTFNAAISTVVKFANRMNKKY